MKFTMPVKPEAIAKTFGFRLCVTWRNLTDEERANVERAMKAMGGKSVNGAPGYFFNLRNSANDY